MSNLDTSGDPVRETSASSWPLLSSGDLLRVSLPGRLVTASKPVPPAGLGASGRSLWRSVVAEYVLRPDELTVLGAACRTVDELELLRVALATGPVMVAGSKGQPVPNPLLSEIRSHRALLGSLLKQIGISEAVEDDGAARSRSANAVKAARARWGDRSPRPIIADGTSYGA